MTTPVRRSREETARLGKAIYDRDIRPQVEADHNGEFVAVDVGSGSWSLANTTFETDREDFDISSSGVLRFRSSPDYEDPDDSNDDNIYKVTVRASDGSLTADRHVTVTVTDVNETPEKVTGLVGAPGSVGGTIDLDWDPAAGADDYEVAQWKKRYPILPGYHWVTLDDSEVTIDASNTSAVVTGLQGGETYRHSVRGVRGTGSDKVEGPLSEYVDTTLTLPDKVKGLTGSSGSNHGEISLTWSDANGATGYQVRQKKPRPFPIPDTWIELPGEGFGVSITGTSAVVSNLDPDKTYVYQVRGTNVHDEGEWSDSSAETSVRDERPDKPQGLVFAGNLIGDRGISLRWQAAAGAQGYEVEASPAESSQQIVISGASAEVTGLTPDRRYNFKVRAWKLSSGSRLYSPWSDTIEQAAPTPRSSGHPEDHTVVYQKGPITPASGLPTGVPDPARVISAAIDPAATAWNTAAAVIAGKNLKICEVGNCGGSNHDGWTVTVKTESGPNASQNNSCGPSTACVSSSIDGDNRWREQSLIIEEPAWACRGHNSTTGTCAQHARIYWTDRSGLDLRPVPNLSDSYYYIDPVMIHEFGHTLGLPDFYKDNATGLKGLPAIMGSHPIRMTITAEDIVQLRAIYAVHDSASH